MTTNLDKDTLEWAAQWIEGSLKGETNKRVIEFGRNMAMTLRAAATPSTATAAEPTHDQVVQAITDIQEARESHLQWASHLRQPHTFECQGCEDHAAHIGDAEYHDEWIAKYDNVIYVLAHAPFTAVAATSGAREAAVKEIIELDLNGRYDPYDPHSRNAILGILSKHFPSAVPVEEQKHPLDAAIEEAEDDLRVTCPEMFAGKPISMKRESE